MSDVEDAFAQNGGAIDSDAGLVIVDTNQLQERFKFFEEFKEEKKEPRRESLLPRIDTAKKMLCKFKRLESQSSTETQPQGPKPLKRITPPRDFNGLVTATVIRDTSPERDPNIGLSCMLCVVWLMYHVTQNAYAATCVSLPIRAPLLRQFAGSVLMIYTFFNCSRYCLTQCTHAHKQCAPHTSRITRWCQWRSRAT